jgi:hypothetical protein
VRACTYWDLPMAGKLWTVSEGEPRFCSTANENSTMCMCWKEGAIITGSSSLNPLAAQLRSQVQTLRPQGSSVFMGSKITDNCNGERWICRLPGAL